MTEELQVEVFLNKKYISAGTDIEKHIYDLDSEIDTLSSHADKCDYLVAIASGLLCGMMDILLVGEFDLVRGRDIADEKVNEFVQKTAEKLGCKDRDIKSSVAFLEKMFPIPSDGNTSDFGGGLQHHLRDFAHHPTVVGLMFSLLTQFTEKSYGTDIMGNFLIVPVPEKSKIFIGQDVPSKKYDSLHSPMGGYKEAAGDVFLETFFTGNYYTSGYIKRLRKCHSKVLGELNEVLKTALTSLAVSAGIAITAIITAGAFAPAIAVALVGSNFAGLSGAALTSACLAYLGGGAIAAGGLGMAGGTMVIVGGGAVLGLGVGAGVGGVVSAVGMMGKKGTILQSAKLLVSVREIFLNDEHDLEYSNTIFEQYVKNIAEIEKGLVELRLKADVASREEKKQLKLEIKNAEESVNAMKIAMKSMNKYKSAYAIGD